jgi:hypothetical protein
MFPMTLPQVFGWVTLALTCAVVFWRGRRPERIGISIVAVGWVATTLVQRLDSWYQPQFGIMSVDALILAAFIAMAFRYDRYWTICAAAFQAIAVFTHFVFLIDPKALYRAYYFGNFAIGFLILGAILGGAFIESAAPQRRSPPSPGPPSGPELS